MLSLQKPMPRGKYALLAPAHALLLGGLLWAMGWCELNYLPPVSALAYLAGIGVLASLVAITIRRMRDAGIRGLLLLCVPAWLGGVLMIHLVYWWLLAALPMTHPNFLPDDRLSIINLLIIISGALLASATVAMLCAPTAPQRRCPPPAKKEPAFVTALARSFCIRRKASLSEFCAYFPLSMGLLYALLAVFRHFVAWENMWDPFPIFHPQHLLLIPFILTPACVVLALPAVSVSLRRLRDTGHLHRWLIGFILLMLGFYPAVTGMVSECYFPEKTSFWTTLYVQAYGLLFFVFKIYTICIFIKRGRT